MTLHIEELRPGQLVIGRYHSLISGRVTEEEPVRFAKLDEGVAHFLRQNDDDVWEPLPVRMYQGKWSCGMAMIPFSIRPIDWRPAGVLAVDIHGEEPEAVLDFISARLGIPVTDETRIDEMTAEALHLEWDAARMILQ